MVSLVTMRQASTSMAALFSEPRHDDASLSFGTGTVSSSTLPKDDPAVVRLAVQEGTAVDGALFVAESAPEDDTLMPAKKPQQPTEAALLLLDTHTNSSRFTTAASHGKSHESLLPPRIVWDDYVAAHSVTALRREWDERRLVGKTMDDTTTTITTQNGTATPSTNVEWWWHDRKFTIAYYSCPLQAGNRLHHFFNQLLWAVVTNRTLLWKYYDRAACLAFGARHFDPKICQAANDVVDCDKVLERAAWMPSYEEWADRLGSAAVSPVRLNVWTTHPPPDTVTGPSGNTNTTSNRPTLATPFHRVVARKFGPYVRPATPVDTHGATLVIFPIMLAKYRDLGSSTVRAQLLQNTLARTRAADLYARGEDFLYGMFFRQSFGMRDVVLASTQRAAGAIPPHAYSLAVHSRHVRPTDEGRRIQAETTCLQKLLLDRKASVPCVVHVMADRAATRTLLQEWLATQDCQVVMTEPNGNRTASFRKEHGPFAGAAFFQDLASASRARDGFVGGDRSSTDLLLELIEYDRVTESVARGETNMVSRIPQCLLP
jgi:hypothetical protein